jgi:hypothetical protein
VFFGDHPEELQKLTVDQRQWIVLSFRNFAKYYLRLTGSDDVEEAVRLRIKRYSLNVGLGFENRLILVDEGYIGRMSKAVVEQVKGELGIIAKTGLFAGTREDELVHIHDTPMCNKEICDADRCKNLHIISIKNGMTVLVVNWHRRGKHCYFTILPTTFWQRFKALPCFTYHESLRIYTCGPGSISNSCICASCTTTSCCGRWKKKPLKCWLGGQTRSAHGIS